MNPITKLKNLTSQGNWMMRALLITTVVLGFSYIWQVNVAATSGYAMRDLDRGISALEHDNERLKLTVSRLQSVDSVTTRMQMLGLVEMEEVKYVVGGDSAVAVNR